MLEKWTTNFQAKVVTQCRGLTLTGDVQDLIQNAEATEVDDGNVFSFDYSRWNGDNHFIVH
jgi:hypothetical protein